jgi:transposase
MPTKGRGSARVLRRASILGQLDHERQTAQAPASVGMAEKTVRALVRRYEEQGLELVPDSRPTPYKQ